MDQYIPSGKSPSPYQQELALAQLMRVRQELIEQYHPDIVDDEKLFADTLEGEGGDAIEVLYALLRERDKLDFLAKAAKQRADQMYERSERLEHKADIIKRGCLGIFDILGLKRVELPELTVSIARGRPSVVVPDPKMVPPEYRHEPEEPPPDRHKIGDALKEGQQFDWAFLSNGAPSLRFKRT